MTGGHGVSNYDNYVEFEPWGNIAFSENLRKINGAYYRNAGYFLF